MRIYGCELVNGNIRTSMFEKLISDNLASLIGKIEEYIQYDFQDEYDLEDLSLSNLRIDIACNDVESIDYYRLVSDKNWSGLNDMLTDKILVYLPKNKQNPFGRWVWEQQKEKEFRDGY